MPKTQRDPLDILSAYQKRVAMMKAQQTPHKEIQPLTIQEVMYIKLALHPTAKQESKDLTKELIRYICNEGIVTAEQIYEKYGWSDKPVMKRLKLLREFGLLKRESKKFYMPTPRMLELKEKYLERVCG